MFSLDSKFMQYLNRAADLVGLNLLFLLTCLPVITIGAASTAMYTVLFRFGTDRENGVFKPYFRAFRDNFKQATVVWVILGLVMAVLWIDARFFLAQSGWMTYLSVVFGILFAMAAMTTGMAFPLLSQFDNTVKGTLRNAALLSMAYGPRALGVLALNLLPGLFFLLMPVLFLRLGVVWFMIYSSGSAYLSTMLLRKVMEKLKEAGEEKTEEA